MFSLKRSTAGAFAVPFGVLSPNYITRDDIFKIHTSFRYRHLGCLTGRGLVQRRGGGGGYRDVFLPLPLPLAHFFHLTPTPSGNISSPQSSTVTKSKMEAYYKNLHSGIQNTPALQAIPLRPRVKNISSHTHKSWHILRGSYQNFRQAPPPLYIGVPPWKGVGLLN